MKYYFEDNGKDRSCFDFRRFAEGYGVVDLGSEKHALCKPFPFLDKLRWIDTQSDRAKEYIRRLWAYLE